MMLEAGVVSAEEDALFLAYDRRPDLFDPVVNNQGSIGMLRLF